MRRRVFVAGATGVVGRQLVPRLVEHGHEVVALARRPEAAARLHAAGVESVIADACDVDELSFAVARARPDVVMHQLTDLKDGDPAANARQRRIATRHLVDAAQAAGVSRMIVQSIAWAYAPGDLPATERVPLDVGAEEPRATTVNGVAALEAAAREMPEWVALRYGQFYGPGTWFGDDGKFAADVRAGHLPATGDVVSFVHVSDAAAAAVEALDWPSGAVNVCDEEPAPGWRWVPAFAGARDAASPPIADRPRAPWARGADSRRAREELGWRPAYASWRTGFLNDP